MSFLGKKKDEKLLRKKYSDPSSFLQWVESLDLERQGLGRWVLWLERNFHMSKVLGLFLFTWILLQVVSWAGDSSKFRLPYSGWSQNLFLSLLITLVAVVSFGFLKRLSRTSNDIPFKDLGVLAVISLLVLSVSQGILFLARVNVVEQVGHGVPEQAFLFLPPLLAGSMLAALLVLSAETVWVFALFTSMISAWMLGLRADIFIVTLVTSVFGAQSVYRISSRNSIYWAGFKAGLVKAGCVVLITALSSTWRPGGVVDWIWLASAGLASGLLASGLILMLIPLFETAFNYTTDLKLLELSSLNHPLIQDLMLKAPGTYHHCMAVGIMVDAAARKIDANPLLAKVMAIYHDIGKMEHAQYFIENQRPGENPHRSISPHMSKTILVAHVKDGAEMAIRHKLGQPIVDGILQHHGTTLISYFYNQAMEAHNPKSMSHIDESDFRYPGPRPQFKEAALCMLADSIEATARSLDEPTKHRLDTIVENIVESKFVDGQLDECNLTIEDLAVIKVTFKTMLGAIYHQRMKYPHMEDGKPLVVASHRFGHKKA